MPVAAVAETLGGTPDETAGTIPLIRDLRIGPPMHRRKTSDRSEVASEVIGGLPPIGYKTSTVAV